jgi:membrane-bound metal-dependent hydrolase YbcI (DUF457 family)
MMWHGHAASGVVVGEALSPLVPHTVGIQTVPLFIVLAAVGALVPDLDHRDGKLSHSLGPITWVICRVTVWFSKGIFVATRGPRDFRDSNGHRGITHTPVFAPVVAAAAWFLVPGGYALPVAVGLLVGQWAHQAGDACTNSGVPLLWPLKINGRRWGHRGIPKALRFETGGTVEGFVTVALYGLCVALPAFYAWLGWTTLAELTR